MSDKPRVLIVGDSISMGYTPPAAELLARIFHHRDHRGHRSSLTGYLCGETGVVFR